MNKDLYFERNNGELILLQSNVDMDTAFSLIHSFCNEHNYTVYYIRENKFTNGDIQLDVGSHTEFFWLKNTENKCK